jgi:penicillin-binding protein activator
MKTMTQYVALLAIAALLSGCAMFRRSITEGTPGETKPISASYDQNDLLKWSAEVANAILAVPFPSADEKQPIMVVMGIQNRTLEHQDTKALADTITTKLMDSGKMRFVNADRRDDLLKEQGFQLANATPETRVAIGKQLGAKYMLTGSITEIRHSSGRQARVSKKEDVYYQLTVEITELETGLITVRKQFDRLRSTSKPIIGW